MKLQEPGPYGKGFGTQIALLIWFILIGFLSATVLAFPTKWLWNWVMVDIFNLVKISAWQAWGLLMLAHLLIPRGQTRVEKSSKPQTITKDINLHQRS